MTLSASRGAIVMMRAFRSRGAKSCGKTVIERGLRVVRMSRESSEGPVREDALWEREERDEREEVEDTDDMLCLEPGRVGLSRLLRLFELGEIEFYGGM